MQKKIFMYNNDFKYNRSIQFIKKLLELVFAKTTLYNGMLHIWENW